MTARLFSRRLFVGTGLAQRDHFHRINAGARCRRRRQRLDRNKVTSKDGTRIAFDRSGDGPALILVGGALSDRSAWAPLAKLLAPRFTVFSYDRRGRGDSEDTPPYSVEREIEDIEALIDEAGGAAFVHGQSSGAVLALEATAKLPAKVKKLSLYEPPFIIDDSRPPPPENFVKHINELIAAESPRRRRRVLHDRSGGRACRSRRADAKRANMASARGHGAYPGLRHRRLGRQHGRQPLPTDRWAAATAPTLVMDGGASPAWIRNSARALADLLPNAQHRTLEGQTHDAAPEVLAPEIERFFLG